MGEEKNIGGGGGWWRREEKRDRYDAGQGEIVVITRVSTVPVEEEEEEEVVDLWSSPAALALAADAEGEGVLPLVREVDLTGAGAASCC